MVFKLYGSPMSTCTARVKAVLEELNLKYELIPINFNTGEHKQPPHIHRNPFGQVPAFEDGDLTLFESRAITRYLANNYHSGGAPDLVKKNDRKAGGEVNVWIEVESQQFNPAISPIFYQIFVAPRFGAAPDQNIIKDNLEKLGKVLDVYEARLSKSKYLAGDFFSLADLHHIPYTFYFMATPHASLINSRPHVKAWWEDISSRTACKKATDDMQAAVAAASK
ncbi:Glutathione transferase protein [Dioscorea alata]|uniref:Glutathione transferase protein n=1 Tax=Dioscorea alata TaxID=55571 RepID=A0ACB7U3Z6_DIOAL|nr:Glutathione transferase protein [Dioscorea alata]